MNIAIITGASSGMGREFVTAIDRAFPLDEIWVIARRAERLEELRPLCRAANRPLALDLLERSSFDALESLLTEHKPTVQVLINAAGVGLFGTFSEMDRAKQLDIIDLNATALTAVTHLCLPYIPAGGHIVNVASNSSWQPVPYINVYGASKA